MIGWALKLFSGLPSALGAFLNPWVWLVILATSSSLFLYGNHLGNQRLVAYQKAQEQVEKGKEAVIKYVVVQQKVIDQEIVNELQERNDRLTRNNAALLNSLSKHIQARITLGRTVPSTPGGDEDGDIVSVSRSKLVAGIRDSLRRFVVGYSQGLERGDHTLSLLESCSEFIERQSALTGGIQQ